MSFSCPCASDLALLAQVAREEEDQADLRELARLELERPESTQSRTPLTVSPMPGHGGQEQERDRGDAEEVAVRLEHAVVVPEPDERPARGRRRRRRPRPPAGRRRRDRGGRSWSTPNAVSTAVSGRSAPSAYGTVRRTTTCATTYRREEERAPGDGARRDLRVARDA